MSDVADSWFAAGRIEDALTMREEVLALRRKVHDPVRLETLTAMGDVIASYAAESGSPQPPTDQPESSRAPSDAPSVGRGNRRAQRRQERPRGDLASRRLDPASKRISSAWGYVNLAGHHRSRWAATTNRSSKASFTASTSNRCSRALVCRGPFRPSFVRKLSDTALGGVSTSQGIQGERRVNPTE